MLRGREPVERIEVKASLCLPLQQISRYLPGSSPLILVRVITGHVVMLRPEQLNDFSDLRTVSLSAKAERMLRGEPFVVPGPSCRGCPELSCPYHEDPFPGKKRLIAMSGPAFEKDMTRFYENLPGVCEFTAKLVIDELNRGGLQK